MRRKARCISSGIPMAAASHCGSHASGRIAVASLTLYEPVGVPRAEDRGSRRAAAFDTIMELAGQIDRAVLCGAYWAAAERFVDHWNGAGAWAAIDPAAQSPEWRATFRRRASNSARWPRRPTPRAIYRQFDFPTLLLIGELTSEPVRLIARQLAEAMKPASLRTVFGAGHMGPFTHAAAVNAMIASHIMRVETGREGDGPFQSPGGLTGGTTTRRDPATFSRPSCLDRAMTVAADGGKANLAGGDR